MNKLFLMIQRFFHLFVLFRMCGMSSGRFQEFLCLLSIAQGTCYVLQNEKEELDCLAVGNASHRKSRHLFMPAFCVLGLIPKFLDGGY